jgi:hypothetical protein
MKVDFKETKFTKILASILPEITMVIFLIATVLRKLHPLFYAIPSRNRIRTFVLGGTHCSTSFLCPAGTSGEQPQNREPGSADVPRIGSRRKSQRKCKSGRAGCPQWYGKVDSSEGRASGVGGGSRECYPQVEIGARGARDPGIH